MCLVATNDEQQLMLCEAAPAHRAAFSIHGISTAMLGDSSSQIAQDIYVTKFQLLHGSPLLHITPAPSPTLQQMVAHTRHAGNRSKLTVCTADRNHTAT